MMKFLSLVVGIILLVGAVFYLAKAPEWAAANKIVEAPVNLDVADDPSVKLEISWLGPCYFGSGLEGTAGQRKLEERFNVTLKPYFLDDNAYRRRKPLMLSGGDIPDVVWENDPSVLQRDVQQGFLTEIPVELLKKYCPTYVSYMNEYAPIGWVYCNVDGKNYGLPTQNLGGIYPSPGVWRMDWLEKVGIHKVPETLDEMHEALKRISAGDPRGDGTKVYGMSGTFQDWWWTSFAEIFGAYGVAPFDWQLDSKGEVTWGGIMPEAKEALALLCQWRAEGLIDPQFTTDRMGAPTKDLENKFKNGKLGYLYYRGTYDQLDETNPGSLIVGTTKMNPDAKLAAGWFPLGPTGKRGGRQWGAGGNIIAFGPGVKKDPRKLIRVLRMLEEMTTDQNQDPETSLAIVASTGERGKEWDWKRAGDPHSGRKMLPPYDNPSVAKQNVMGNSPGFFVMVPGTPEIGDRTAELKAVEFRNTYQKPEWALIDLLGKPDVVPSSGKYLTNLQQMQKQIYTKIISGELPLDAFDSFVADWRRSHGDELIAEARAAQETKLRLYKELGVPERWWK